MFYKRRTGYAMHCQLSFNRAMYRNKPTVWYKLLTEFSKSDIVNGSDVRKNVGCVGSHVSYLAAMEDARLIECVDRNKKGKVYSITREGLNLLSVINLKF